jgi:hypothetical protein
MGESRAAGKIKKEKPKNSRFLSLYTALLPKNTKFSSEKSRRRPDYGKKI